MALTELPSTSRNTVWPSRFCRTSTLPLLQPLTSSGSPSPSRSKDAIAVGTCLLFTRHALVILSYTPMVPLRSAYPNLVPPMVHRRLTASASVTSATCSSLAYVRIAKSSLPTMSSFCESALMSHSVRLVTLSPVTVQYSSLPSLLKPCTLQLPPTTHRFSSMAPTLPNAIVFTPSGTSLKNLSAFSSTSYARRSLWVPTNRASLPSPSRDPAPTALIFLLMFRYLTPSAFVPSRACGEWMKILPPLVAAVRLLCLPSYRPTAARPS
mmetsp:Transcript_12403/g.43000  ORF Transcript_12403/g.43000 Transcript_12403/m.43000 type:complete len:267 (-) Transcript_12403:66-866(-)